MPGAETNGFITKTVTELVSYDPRLVLALVAGQVPHDDAQPD